MRKEAVAAAVEVAEEVVATSPFMVAAVVARSPPRKPSLSLCGERWERRGERARLRREEEMWPGPGRKRCGEELR